MHRKNHILTILTLACLFQGCALGQKDNRILLNALDKGVADTPISRSAWSRTAAAPLAIPVGVAAVVVDLVLITPARALTPAWQDTSAFLWENPLGSDFRQMALLLPKIAATPVLFGSDWAVRSLFGFTRKKGRG